MITISNNVMKKVRVIFWARRLTSRRALECYVLLASTLGLFSFVSVPHVIANMPSVIDIVHLSGFMLAAFAHTNLLVQITLSIMVLVFLLTLFDFVQGSFLHRRADAHIL